MITITLTEDCGIKAGGLDIYAAGVRKISCPGNIGTGRETIQIFNIPFNWCYGEASEWNSLNTIQLKIEGASKNIMGQDFEMQNEDGDDKYIYSDGGKIGLEALHYMMSNYGKQIIEEFFPNIGNVEVTYLA
tara:strand:- start:261 stop:656 length:396 start_codon:yes stop_codon:yes gene_type:complete